MTDERIGQVSYDAAMLQAIEGDLVDFHRRRMSKLQGELSLQLIDERAKPNPDPEVVATLEVAMVQAERDKRDTSITEREVLVPLRERLR